MTNNELESSKLASEVARKTAARQGEAITKYGELVTKYSKDEIEALELSRESLQLFVREGYSLVQDAMRMSSLYWQWVAEVWGTAVSKTPPPRAEISKSPSPHSEKSMS